MKITREEAQTDAFARQMVQNTLDYARDRISYEQAKERIQFSRDTPHIGWRPFREGDAEIAEFEDLMDMGMEVLGRRTL